MAIDQGPIKVVFLVHFILTSWAMFASWIPAAYFFYNSVFLLTILWGMHAKEKEAPIFLAFIIDACSILLDVILICVYFHQANHASDIYRFAAVMCILNLIFRPISFITLMKIHQQRTGNYGNIGIPALDNYFGGTHHGNPYEDIDGPSYPQSVPQNTLDTGSPMHPDQDHKPVIP